MHLSRLLVEKPDSVFELFCPELLSCSVFFLRAVHYSAKFLVCSLFRFRLSERSVSTTRAITIAITIYCNLHLFKAF